MTENIELAEFNPRKTLKPKSNGALRRAGNWDIGSFLDLELPLGISFGSLEMPLEDVLKLGVGSVIELDESVNDPVTIIVNHSPIAKGEMVAVGGNYGIRILEVKSRADRIRSLGWFLIR